MYVVDGMKITSNSMSDCEVCVKAKQCETIGKEPRSRCQNVFDLVHTDLSGPVDPIGIRGFKYVCMFTDDYSGAHFEYFMKQKSDAVIALEQFIADTQWIGKVKVLRCDQGTEFTSSKFKDVLRDNKIRQEFSSPHSPSQNGVAERSWRSVYEMARCLMFQSNLPKSFWVYAIQAAVYIRNRCYCPRTKQTPYFLVTQKKPDLSKMHVFGAECLAYEHGHKKKFDPRAHKGIFVGYAKRSPAYLLYHPELNSVKEYRIVRFVSSPLNVESETTESCEWSIDSDSVEQNENVQNDHVPENVVQTERRYPDRMRQPPKYLQNYVVNSVDIDVDHCYKVTMGIPQTFEQSKMSDQSEAWQKAMDAEIDSMNAQGTYEVVPRPKDKNVVSGKWVYNMKHGNGNWKYKARYVARGFNQIEGIDYHETFSPTIAMTSLRVVMQLAAHNDLLVHQLDMKTAYLNAPIEEEVYLEQPQGYIDKGTDYVWKLKKSIYGLKQSGRNWYNMLSRYLIDSEFKKSQADPCLFTKQSGGSYAVVLFWVDDIIVAAKSESDLQKVKDHLMTRFTVTDFGQLSFFLGVQFSFSSDGISMDQKKYLKKVLDRFGMSDCKAKRTPCEMKLEFDEGEPLTDDKVYREMIGCLIYCMTCTRPDLAFCVTKMSQYLSKPTQDHLNAVKRILRYIKGTIDYKLTYSKLENLSLCGFSDSDWGNDTQDRKSITGYCFALHDKGPPVSWKSRKQNTIALSSCEAEYVAMCHAVQEGKYLLQLLSDMNAPLDCMNLSVDNQGAIALSKDPVKRQRTKHIDVKHHFIRDEVQSGHVIVDYIPSESNVADLFTKPTSRVKLNSFEAYLFGACD